MPRAGICVLLVVCCGLVPASTAAAQVPLPPTACSVAEGYSGCGPDAKRMLTRPFAWYAITREAKKTWGSAVELRDISRRRVNDLRLRYKVGVRTMSGRRLVAMYDVRFVIDEERTIATRESVRPQRGGKTKRSAR